MCFEQLEQLEQARAEVRAPSRPSVSTFLQMQKQSMQTFCLSSEKINNIQLFIFLKNSVIQS
jgi:hypothetical protein